MKTLSMIAVALVVSLLAGASAGAETFKVEMRNRGERGSMVFEPDFLALKPGDSIKFIATHKSHNAASIDGMVPEGYAGFKGKINEEIEVTFDQPGFYGIKCSPHFGMGMVMLVKVGEAELTDTIRTVGVPARARPRFDEIFARIDAGEGK
ncbi:pseudoazurin [Shinella kummerowiae]|uniref:pseudoazurin n=1 Tax=Shinella kummerowiae TaxID=417745 RepID=UPI0021B6B334|nr:pseudoazurin [Shinella kummerowiae]MCT7664729.1 pseudoazurin [Shinella kummerowiae]